MVYELVFKKRFQNKLEKLLVYLEKKYGLLLAQKFADRLQKKFVILQLNPYMGIQSVSVKNVRSTLAGKQNRIYYRVVKDKIIVLNMYDTRMNPAKNKLR